MSQERTGAAGWGGRWIQDLQRLSTAWQNRLPRGRDYAAKGHVLTLTVTAGRITAKVQGSRSKPYSSSIDVPANRDADWDRLIRRLAQEARFPAQLLNGEMPSDIEDLFREEGLALFPVRNSELIGQCNCPDKARPCKHIAAVHFAFGEALDRDPFLLFQLRGADRDTLLRGFQRVWFGREGGHHRAERRQQEADATRGVRVIPLLADRFNRAPSAALGLNFRVQASDNPLLVLQRLQEPRPWELPIGTRDLFGPVYEEVARLALRLALEGVRELDEEDENDTSEEFGDDDYGEEEDDDYGEEDVEEGGESGDFDPVVVGHGADDGFVSLARSGPLPDDGIGMPDEPAAERSGRRSQPTPPGSSSAGGRDMLSSMLGDALPRPARPPARAASDDPPPQSAEPSVLIRRGSSEGGARRRRKGKAQQEARRSAPVRVVTGHEERAVAGATVEASTDEALEALQRGAAGEALAAARQAWRGAADLARLLLLLNCEPEGLDDERASLERLAGVRPLQLTGAQLVLLVLAGSASVAVEAMNERVDKGLDPGCEAADLMTRAALRLLLAGRDGPAGSALAVLLQSLDTVPAELRRARGRGVETLGDALDRVGSSSLAEEDRDALTDAACNAVLGLLEAASPRADRDDAEHLAALATAVAEGLQLADDHRRLSLFLHRSHTSATGRTGLAMKAYQDDSPILAAGLVVEDA
ncbi:MAG: hypothetical protein EA398_02305 [Deltaproteobacteria bacterium]|nr:MAG: hypothetical protein EA398_02305 [Deltaproteobacteria bacterium]